MVFEFHKISGISNAMRLGMATYKMRKHRLETGVPTIQRLSWGNCKRLIKKRRYYCQRHAAPYLSTWCIGESPGDISREANQSCMVYRAVCKIRMIGQNGIGQNGTDTMVAISIDFN